jgi:hypothetical protein
MSCFDESFLDGILDGLDRWNRLPALSLDTLDHTIREERDRRKVTPTDRFDRFTDSMLDLRTIEGCDHTIAFFYLIECHGKEKYENKNTPYGVL